MPTGGLQEGQLKKEPEKPKTPPHTEEASESGFSLTSNKQAEVAQRNTSSNSRPERRPFVRRRDLEQTKMRRQLCGSWLLLNSNLPKGIRNANNPCFCSLKGLFAALGSKVVILPFIPFLGRFGWSWGCFCSLKGFFAALGSKAVILLFIPWARKW